MFNLVIYIETGVCGCKLNLCPSSPSKEAHFMTCGFYFTFWA